MKSCPARMVGYSMPSRWQLEQVKSSVAIEGMMVIAEKGLDRGICAHMHRLHGGSEVGLRRGKVVSAAQIQLQ